MKLSPQEQTIINILSDFRPHCLSVECYIKDDRARISALRKKGFIFAEIGVCREPTHKHYAPLKLRQLLNNPVDSGIPTYCCGERLRKKEGHSSDCKFATKTEVTLF